MVKIKIQSLIMAYKFLSKNFGKMSMLEWFELIFNLISFSLELRYHPTQSMHLVRACQPFVQRFKRKLYPENRHEFCNKRPFIGCLRCKIFKNRIFVRGVFGKRLNDNKNVANNFNNNKTKFHLVFLVCTKKSIQENKNELMVTVMSQAIQGRVESTFNHGVKLLDFKVVINNFYRVYIFYDDQ